MAQELAGKKIAFLATDGVEQVELTEPWKAVEQAGGNPELVSIKRDRIQAVNHLDKADTFPVDKLVSDVGAADYDALVQPGGVANADFLRMDERAVRFVRDFFSAGKPVAAICHGPWMLCSTDVLKGRRATSYMSIAHDVVNAGAKWVDEECVVDGPIITSRCPDDLPSFSNAILRLVSEGKAEGVKGKPIAPAWLMETIPPMARIVM